jgi:hypothetical protein
MKQVFIILGLVFSLSTTAQNQDWIVGTWTYWGIEGGDTLSSQQFMMLEYRFKNSFYDFNADSICNSSLSGKKFESTYILNEAQDSVSLIAPGVQFRLPINRRGSDTLVLFFANLPVMYLRTVTSIEEMKIEDIER